MSEPRRPEGIFLDHHSTTPCDPRVVEAMLPYFTEVFGNPSSEHAWGHRSLEAVEEARSRVAGLLGCEPSEIVFTSGATESDNLALFGSAAAERESRRRGGPRRHVITCVSEHKAVLDACARLEQRHGCEVTYLPIEADGRVEAEAVRRALRPDTLMVSLMLANNEIGVLHPIGEIAAVCRERGVLLHTDAAQALAYTDCRLGELGADLMSLSAHKAYGPKGVGALYARRRRPRVRLEPQLLGGGHERGRRSGTLAVSQIVGFGAACELIAAERRADARRLEGLRDRLLGRLRGRFPGLVVNGTLEPGSRLPNSLNVSLPRLAEVGITSRDVLAGIAGEVALSTGSACTASSFDGSYVLKALPGARPLAEVAFRFGLGRGTRAEEVDRAADVLCGECEKWIERAAGSAASSAAGSAGECGAPPAFSSAAASSTCGVA
ncbi:MAG: cysteine desulfurase family protein [Acidobacteriota bacterium]